MHTLGWRILVSVLYCSLFELQAQAVVLLHECSCLFELKAQAVILLHECLVCSPGHLPSFVYSLGYHSSLAFICLFSRWLSLDKQLFTVIKMPPVLSTLQRSTEAMSCQPDGNACMWPGCPLAFPPVKCGAKECTKVLHHMCQNNWEDELCRNAFPDQPWPPVLPEEGLSEEGMFDNPFEQSLWRCYDCYVPIDLDKARAARASANTKGSTSTIPSGVNDDDEDDASSIYSGISSDSDISVISIVTQATTGVAPKATSRVIRNKLKRASDAAADGLEVIDLEADDLESDASNIIDLESDAHLIKPTNKKSLFWTCFLVYDSNFHFDKEGIAVCCVDRCGKEILVRNGTGGLQSHVMYAHTERFGEIEREKVHNSTLANKKKKNDGRQASLKSDWGVTSSPKTIILTLAQRKLFYTRAAAAWVIEDNQSFRTVVKPSYRRMFNPIEHMNDASAIVNINADKIRSRILTLGRIAKEATGLEMSKHKVSITSDHWTSPNHDTYSVITSHWIEDWRMQSAIMDFKVFHGRTTGRILADDMVDIIENHVTQKRNFVICQTDTTGSQGKLGKFLRDEGYEHGYCGCHNFHRNAILAFMGKVLSLSFLFYIS